MQQILCQKKSIKFATDDALAYIHKFTQTEKLLQHCVQNEAIGVTVPQMIRGVVSDSRYPLFLLRVVHKASAALTDTRLCLHFSDSMRTLVRLLICACILYPKSIVLV